MLYIAEQLRAELINRDLARLPDLNNQDQDVSGDPLPPCFIEEDRGVPAPDDVGVPLVLHIERSGEFAVPEFEEFRERVVVDIDLRSNSRKQIQTVGRQIKHSFNGQRAIWLNDLFISQILVSGPDLIIADDDVGHFYDMKAIIDVRMSAYE